MQADKSVVHQARSTVWPGHTAVPSIVAPDVGSTRSRMFSLSMSPDGFPIFREIAMDTIFENVAGLDVHQKTIVACVRLSQPQGGIVEQVRTFGTMTGDLLDLSDWLENAGVTHVAMESTGGLWNPVWHILDGRFELLLVNPRG